MELSILKPLQIWLIILYREVRAKRAIAKDVYRGARGLPGRDGMYKIFFVYLCFFKPNPYKNSTWTCSKITCHHMWTRVITCVMTCDFGTCSCGIYGSKSVHQVLQIYWRTALTIFVFAVSLGRDGRDAGLFGK